MRMNYVSNHHSALLDYKRLRTTWDNEIHCGINHAPGAGSISRHVDLQSTVPPLCNNCSYQLVGCIKKHSVRLIIYR